MTKETKPAIKTDKDIVTISIHPLYYQYANKVI